MQPENSSAYLKFINGPAYRIRQDKEDNVVDFSSFSQLNSKFASRNFSVKYVIQGTEIYSLMQSSYSVVAGRYLLTNAFTHGNVIIDSDRIVKGVCIEIAPGLLAEVLATCSDLGAPYPQMDLYDFLTTADFFECDYSAGKTHLGRYLQRYATSIFTHGDSTDLLLSDFFYCVAENILLDQKEVYKYFQSFKSVKISTKKDLLGRLMKGKELMDDCYADKITISEIAQVAMMSEYYFLRLFKRTFNCSPHRYIIDRRLETAMELINKGHGSFMDIAYACGFADIQAFSKSFKKKYGKTPSAERQFFAAKQALYP